MNPRFVHGVPPASGGGLAGAINSAGLAGSDRSPAGAAPSDIGQCPSAIARCHRFLIALLLLLAGGIQAATQSLTPLFNSGDGTYVTTNLAGQNAWAPVSGSYYLYFNVPSSFYFVTGAPVYVRVTYYDRPSGKVSIQYDSTNGAYASSEAHTRSSAVERV
jgi:hypothetical protein